MTEARNSSAPIVVKLGGSLYDLPDLGPRLQNWLQTLPPGPLLLVPGGGRTADVVRHWDAVHHLGEEASHWLALRALTLNAHWLAQLLPGTQANWANGGRQPPVAAGVHNNLLQQGADAPRLPRRISVVDAHAFALADEGQPGALPHSWDVTSDAVAARVAVVAGASSLYLLKSVAIPANMPWTEAAAQGIVDPIFPQVLTQAGKSLSVRAINFREDSYPLRESAAPAGALSRRK